MFEIPGQQKTETSILDDAPPEVRQWIMENFSAFAIIGFLVDGSLKDQIWAANTMARFALYESMRRSAAANCHDYVELVRFEDDDDEEQFNA